MQVRFDAHQKAVLIALIILVAVLCRIASLNPHGIYGLICMIALPALAMRAIYLLGGFEAAALYTLLLALFAVSSWGSFNLDLVCYHTVFCMLAVCLILMVGRIWSLGALLVFPLVIAVFFAEYMVLVYHGITGNDPGHEQIFALMDTNPGELIGYIRTHPAVGGGLALFIGVILLLIGLGAAALKRRQPVKPAIFLDLFIILSIALCFTQSFVPDRLSLGLSVRRGLAIKSLFIETVRQRRNDPAAPGARKTADFANAIYVVVVGEAMNRNHLHLYGYNRETTPLLDARRDQMVVFGNDVASYSTTFRSLHRVLSLASVASGKEYYDPGAYSIFELLRGAGIRTYWLSNQDKWGLFGAGVVAIASGTDSQIFTGDLENLPDVAPAENADKSLVNTLVTGFGHYDETLLPLVADAIAKEPGPTVIFVHLMGSHADYRYRFPPSFRRDWGAEPPAVHNLDWQNLADYDSSVLYTDYILDQIMQRLEAKALPAALLFFSDHGESILMNKQHDPEDFTSGHVEVPMLIWSSPQYRKLYPDLLATAERNAAQPFMQDQMTQVLLDLTHVTGPFYRPERSLLNPAYQPTPRLTMDGTIDYDALPHKYCELALERTGYDTGTCR